MKPPLSWTTHRGTRVLVARDLHAWERMNTDSPGPAYKCAVCHRVTFPPSEEDPGWCPGVTTHPADPMSTHTTAQLAAVGHRPVDPDAPDAAYYLVGDLYVPGYHWSKSTRVEGV